MKQMIKTLSLLLALTLLAACGTSKAGNEMGVGAAGTVGAARDMPSHYEQETADPPEKDEQWDLRPTLVYQDAHYLDPYMPVNTLPTGYEYAGTIDKEMANNTSMEGLQYYTNPYTDMDMDFYVYMECGTPISNDTIDNTQRQWAYVRFIQEGTAEEIGPPAEARIYEQSPEELLASFPSTYQEIKDSEDLVMEVQGQLVNGRLWENFWNAVTYHTPAEVVVARLTVEGDPILYLIVYDGKTFRWYMDASRDTFGAEPLLQSGASQYLLRLENNGYPWFILSDEMFVSYEEYWDWILAHEGENVNRPVDVLALPMVG